MLISNISTIVTAAGHHNWLFIKIETDAGITGWREASTENRETSVRAEVTELAKGLLGRNPMQIEKIWLAIHRGAYWSGGAVSMSALAGIDQALWDIKGKALGVPVYELLGGKVRDRLRTYANGWFKRGTTDPAEGAAAALGMVEMGYDAIKWDPFHRGSQMLTREVEEAAFANIAKIRDAVGPDVDLCIEAHGRFNMASAVRVGQRLEEFRPFFYEEPILHDNPDAMAEVARAVRVPIACGERLLTRWEFRPLLERNCVRIIQPDICHAGGISELKKIANMAEAYYVGVQLHNSAGPIGTLASIHFDASTPNFAIQEFFPPYLARYNQLLTHPIEVDAGRLIVPDRPGLGGDINEAAAAALPPDPSLALERFVRVPFFPYV